MSALTPKVTTVSTALYRRYRPDSFAEVIGQEHVTDPLIAAIDSGRINHAYLFSGPRGCGKTTSARIMARCLNCEQGPTSTPCGTCESCVELATGGPGSLDVVEMDAASHGGVDDARDLRERAVFAPARDRYKVFIIDEAHMVTTQGFNALLKLVEEPPEHVKFIFATTEPEKVIGTIRSRTHHYPFRLVPPEKLTDYLEHLAAQEGVTIENGVLPLVVRAGGGSVRDTLSVLDQVISGAVDNTVTYERAVALLGFTPGHLLDDVVSAVSARDGASLFRVVDQVINSGHSPRRFVEDLLERLRDLIVVLAAGDAAAGLLPDAAPDQLERMRTQARNLGAAGSSRAADLVNEALTSMVGATSPRLQLELLCARLLLPTADADGGLAARVEALEQRQVLESGHMKIESAATSQPVEAAPATPAPVDRAPVAPAPVEPEVAAAEPIAAEPSPPTPPETLAPSGTPAPSDTPVSAEPEPVPPAPVSAEPVASEPAAPVVPAEPVTPDVPVTPAVQVAPTAPVTPAAPATPVTRSTESPAAQYNAEMIRGRWPEVLNTLAGIRRTTWALVSQDAHIAALNGDVLVLRFSTQGLAQAFRSGNNVDNLSQAISQVFGTRFKVEAVVGDEGAPGGQSAAGFMPPPPPPSNIPPAAPAPQQPAPQQTGPNQPSARPQEATTSHTSSHTPSHTPSAGTPPAPTAGTPAFNAPPPVQGSAPADPAPGWPAPEAAEAPSSQFGEPAAATPPRAFDPAPAAEPAPDEPAPPWDVGPGTATSPAAYTPEPAYDDRTAATEDEASPDDQVLADPHGGLVGQPLIAKMLGGVVIDEILDEG